MSNLCRVHVGRAGVVSNVCRLSAEIVERAHCVSQLCRIHVGRAQSVLNSCRNCVDFAPKATICVEFVFCAGRAYLVEFDSKSGRTRGLCVGFVSNTPVLRFVSNFGRARGCCVEVVTNALILRRICVELVPSLHRPRKLCRVCVEFASSSSIVSMCVSNLHPRHNFRNNALKDCCHCPRRTAWSSAMEASTCLKAFSHLQGLIEGTCSEELYPRTRAALSL